MRSVSSTPYLISTWLGGASCHIHRRTGAGWDPWPWSSQGSRFVVSLSGYIRFPWTGTYRFGMQGARVATPGLHRSHVCAVLCLTCKFAALLCTCTVQLSFTVVLEIFGSGSTPDKRRTKRQSRLSSSSSACAAGDGSHARVPRDVSATTCPTEDDGVRMRSLYLSSSDAAGLTLQHADGSAVPLDEAEAWDRDAVNGNGSVVLLQFTQPRGAHEEGFPNP